eukprot:Gregarina_sp_Poly_1__9949@NODE_657_length_6915_cov_53_288989_g499_i0_p3_GENE_NODE_657_length_6915_cov_53_288989_g499_i0NODE_657_length_6915_cov_53_288989_g499_i0_p3_ORF_typecomplete_len476_score40_83MMR_HSR1/PF01926_23/8_5MMR_HSR1/PF01926_23/1_3e14FeoB_N/PF02421_18/0_016FeoB_N/PF02421_18/8_4e11RsgA_GTPase/PF03193_16/0_19RsgA_GTPase/PF03193_16/3_5e08GTP_EFTU/PF00009_27/0_00083GTP_EFTU/PF00009_27/0_065IIGP/PF05049_13/4_6e02IIGP/PF05049_13/0_0012MnmE_helical/PF12631_7/0_00024Dynamin_N/PF00350_23/7_
MAKKIERKRRSAIPENLGTPEQGMKLEVRQNRKLVSKVSKQAYKKRSGKPISVLGAIQRKREFINIGYNYDEPSPPVDEECFLNVDATEIDYGSNSNNQGHENYTKRAFGGKLRHAINEADVIIEVLDIRDPIGYRNEHIEDEIIRMGKKLILLINKCDLIPDTTVIESWLNYLRKYHPCVAFRSMTTQSRSKNSSIKFSDFKITNCPAKLLKSGYEPIGTRELMGILNNYARQETIKSSKSNDKAASNSDVTIKERGGEQHGMKSSSVYYKNIVVAVIGMPNVGKSSVINSLCRNSNKVHTGNIAGITTSVSKIRLSKHIELLDTPGVIIDGGETSSAAILRGCVKNFTDEAAEDAVNILRSLPSVSQQMVSLYGLDIEDVRAEPVTSFLSSIANKKKLLKKGGFRDIKSAARLVIGDWHRGRLAAFSHPPTIDCSLSAGRICHCGPCTRLRESAARHNYVTEVPTDSAEVFSY